MLVYIYSFIAKHQMPATMVSSSSILRMNYSTVKRFIEKYLCTISIWTFNKYHSTTHDWEPYIHEAHLQFTIRTMTCKSDYRKVKFNCKSFQTEMLKRIYTLFTDCRRFKKKKNPPKCKQCRVGTLKIKFYCWTKWQQRMHIFFKSSK